MADKEKNEDVIFNNAIQLKDSKERNAYLAEACGNDHELRANIESLLLANEGTSLLDTPIFETDVTSDASSPTEAPGTVIGRYRLLERIGEGGMAVVYMAEQEKPIRRKVALKIIKVGMDTKSVIARFDAERQALAIMDHPNIAKVLDAGATETGRPYFVMDLVPGLPITEYCDKNRLSTNERLRLFMLVCSAVQHAHQKGIIHRDVKPSNVIVTQHDGKPVPKVIDFGIAKAMNQRLTEKTLFTRYAHIIGTPAYMSPEQAELSDLDIDTRTDIYSLGVLLYELLTGTTPFSEDELREAGYLQMQKIICEEEPTKPSTKLSTLGEELADVAKLHSSSPELMPKLIRGDLDWVVMKTLEKDRTRRYETAKELAMDIERHLEDEPVLAGPPSAGYRFCKFIRRNRLSVMTGSLVTAALLLVAIISIIYGIEAEKAKQEISGLLAGSHVDRAQALCEQGEVGRGMLWLADSLKIAGEDSSDLDRAVRTSLAAWYGRLHSLRTVVKYPAKINAVTFTPDGSRILAACQDGTIRLCDAVTGQPIGGSLNHGSGITSATISPDGNRIATRGVDGSVRLWDGVKLEPVGESIPYENEKRPAIVFSPDSSQLVTETGPGELQLWDASTGKSLGKLFQYEGQGRRRVRAMAFCPDGLRVVLTIDKGIHQMFDAKRAEPIGPPVKQQNTLQVVISPDGNRFATAGYNSLIRIWNAETGELAIEPIVHGGTVYALAFSPDGSQIIAGGNTRAALLWDAITGEAVGPPLRQRNIISAAAFNTDGTRVVTGNEDGVVQVWNLVQGKHFGRYIQHNERILGATFGPRGLRILTEINNMIQIRDAATGRPIGKPFSHPAQFYQVVFSSDDSHFVTQRARFGRLQVWNMVTGELVGELFHRIPHCIAFSPDGSRILTGGEDSIARLWDTATLECLGEFRQHKRTVAGVAFSPDGSQCLTGSYDGTTQLLNAKTLEPIGKPIIHQSEVKSLAFSPDGTKILIGFADGTIRLYDAATLKPIGTPLQYVKIVCAVDFSPNGSQILACSIEKTARLWDTATLKPIGPPLEHNGWWPRASFSPDGSQILVTDGSGMAQVWEAPSGPIQGERERIICWVQMVTGLELDSSGGINVLDAPTWQQRRQRLLELGGPPGLSLSGMNRRTENNQ